MGPGTGSLHDLYHIVADGLVHHVAVESGQGVPGLLEPAAESVGTEPPIAVQGIGPEAVGGFLVAGGPGGERGDGGAFGGEERALLFFGGQSSGLGFASRLDEVALAEREQGPEPPRFGHAEAVAGLAGELAGAGDLPRGELE